MTARTRIAASPAASFDDVDRDRAAGRGAVPLRRRPRSARARRADQLAQRARAARAESDRRKLASRQPKLSPKRAQLGVQRVDRLGLADRLAEVRPSRRRSSGSISTGSPSRSTTGAQRQLVDQGLQRVGKDGPGGRARGRGRRRITSIALGARVPSSRTARRAITFVFPGLDPMPSSASRPGAARTRRAARAAARSPSRARRGRGSGSRPRGRPASPPG